VGWLAALLFFSVFQKNKCAAGVLAYKNHDKKTDCNTAEGLCALAFVRWIQALAVPVRRAVFHFMG